MRTTVDPVTKSNGIHGSSTTHPAFASISASRINGTTALFGSNVGHHGYVRIRINSAELHNHDGYHESVYSTTRTYVEVELSEAQWVAFISRMNVGTGAPCTLRHCNGLGHIPELPMPHKAAEKMRTQAEQMAESADRAARESAAELRAMIEGKIPKKLQEAFFRLLDRAIGQGQSVRDYQSECLTETKERLVTEAKVEIDAMVSGIVTQLGVESLQQLALMASQQKTLPS